MVPFLHVRLSESLSSIADQLSTPRSQIPPVRIACPPLSIFQATPSASCFQLLTFDHHQQDSAIIPVHLSPSSYALSSHTRRFLRRFRPSTEKLPPAFRQHARLQHHPLFLVSLSFSLLAHPHATQTSLHASSDHRLLPKINNKSPS